MYNNLKAYFHQSKWLPHQPWNILSNPLSHSDLLDREGSKEKTTFWLHSQKMVKN